MRFQTPFIILCVLMLCAALSARQNAEDYSIFSPNELQVLHELLAEAELLPEHCKFYRDWDAGTRLKSRWHLDVLMGGLDAAQPFADLRKLMAEADEQAQISHFFGISQAAKALEIPENTLNKSQAAAKKIKRPKDAFRYLESAFEAVEPLYKKAFQSLTIAQMDSLKAFCVQVMAEDADSLFYQDYFKREKLPWLKDIELDRIADLFEKIDANYLSLAAREYLIWTDALQKRLAELDFTNKKPVFYNSKWGLMILGSVNDDIYSHKRYPKLAKTPVCAVIEPGGNDVYEFALRTSRQNPFYFFWDQAGDDIYRSAEPSFFAWGGLGISYEMDGNDFYQLTDFSFATMLGMMLHFEKSGEDIYQGGLFSQGAAMGGVAILADYCGNDTYTAHTMSQAFGSVLGVGVLADYAGADLYYLGGKYLHAPLMPKDYRSMGQGMGFGLRPAMAGGLGFLYDKRGNDKYIGGVYAQGVGYWYSTGVLIDEGGNDVYNAIYYPQGSGIHCASGFLYDHEGDDAYYSRNGPGQGAGHDWSFGMLVDAAGNDAYSIHGGGGLALSNSFAVFVDKSGDDRYERKEASNYGSGAFSRGTGSIGLFLDAGGKDFYYDEIAQNDSIRVNGKYGIGRDMELNIVEAAAPKKNEDDLEPPAEDAPIKEVWSAASEWEVGNAIQRVRKAREIVLARHIEAADYVFEHRFGSQSGLEYRALEALAAGSSYFSERLYDYVNDADSLKAKNAIALITGLEDLDLLPYLEAHLEAGRYLATCLSALGNLESEASLRLLLSYKDLENERLRFLVARSIAAFKSEAAKAALKEFEADDSFLIQAMIRNLPKDEP